METMYQVTFNSGETQLINKLSELVMFDNSTFASILPIKKNEFILSDIEGRFGATIRHAEGIISICHGVEDTQQKDYDKLSIVYESILNMEKYIQETKKMIESQFIADQFNTMSIGNNIEPMIKSFSEAEKAIRSYGNANKKSRK
jgi:argininosuccinate lyase